MRTFDLIRQHDPTGVSGTGKVAEGVEFSDGVVALRWIVPEGADAHGYPTSVVFHDQGMTSVEKVHGHGGSTIIAVHGDGEMVWCRDCLRYHHRDPGLQCAEHWVDL